MAAAMRALARLGSRACIPAPPLRPGAVPYVEGLQCYSNESFRMADILMKGNSEMFLSTWSKRSRETLKTVLEADHYLYAVSVFGLAIYSGYVTWKVWRPKIPGVSDVKDDGKDED